MVTGLSKAWIGIDNTPSELTMGTGRKETVLYDHTVSTNINLTYSGSYGEYYQYITFPDYIAAVGDEHYDYIYAEYTFIGDAYGTPTDYNPSRTAYATAEVYYATSGNSGTQLTGTACYGISGSTFYFNRLSGKHRLITRMYGVYGTSTYVSPGTGTVVVNIYSVRYIITLKLNYGYTQSNAIYNNSNIQHHIRIVGVI